MEIQGAGSISGPDPIRPNRFQLSQTNSAGSTSTDKVEISDLARFKALLAKVPEMRLEKVDTLRAQIEAGTYETDEKIDHVVDRLLEELF